MDDDDDDDDLHLVSARLEAIFDLGFFEISLRDLT